MLWKDSESSLPMVTCEYLTICLPVRGLKYVPCRRKVINHAEAAIHLCSHVRQCHRPVIQTVSSSNGVAGGSCVQ